MGDGDAKDCDFIVSIAHKRFPYDEIGVFGDDVLQAVMRCVCVAVHPPFHASEHWDMEIFVMKLQPFVPKVIRRLGSLAGALILLLRGISQSLFFNLLFLFPFLRHAFFPHCFDAPNWPTALQKHMHTHINYYHYCYHYCYYYYDCYYITIIIININIIITFM